MGRQRARDDAERDDGWVKTIHESRYGEFLGLVIVAPRLTDLVEAGVVEVDAEATMKNPLRTA